MKIKAPATLSRFFIALSWILPICVLRLHPTTLALVSNNIFHTITTLMVAMLTYDAIRFCVFSVLPALCRLARAMVHWKDAVVNEACIAWNSIFCNEFHTPYVIFVCVVTITNIAIEFEFLLKAPPAVGVLFFLIFLLSNVALFSGIFAWRIHCAKRKARKRPPIAWKPDNSRRPAKPFIPFKPSDKKKGD